jgi:hypothetical protein
MLAEPGWIGRFRLVGIPLVLLSLLPGPAEVSAQADEHTGSQEHREDDHYDDERAHGSRVIFSDPAPSM